MSEHTDSKMKVDIDIRIGDTSLPLEQILNSDPGDLIELDRMGGQPVDILINKTLLGKGELSILGNNLAVRITELS